MNEERTPLWVYICAVSFALISGSISMVSKIASVYMVPVFLVVMRYAISLICNLTGQKLGLFRVRLKEKGIRPALVITGFTYAGTYMFQIIGLTYAQSFWGGIMFATIPIWSEIMAIALLKERPAGRQLIFLMLSAGSLITMVILGTTDGMTEFSPIGVGCLLMMAICESMNNILTRKVKKEYSPMEISFVSCIVAGIIVLLILIGTIATGVMTVSAIKTAITAPPFLLSMLALGVFGTFAAGLLRGTMLHHMSTLKATIWYNLNTPISVLAGVLILKENFHFYQLICTVLIIIGVIGTQLSKKSA